MVPCPEGGALVYDVVDASPMRKSFDLTGDIIGNVVGFIPDRVPACC